MFFVLFFIIIVFVFIVLFVAPRSLRRRGWVKVDVRDACLPESPKRSFSDQFFDRSTRCGSLARTASKILWCAL